jgi:RsiW-degrading membrane proteinase PrsW (M82 family)
MDATTTIISIIAALLAFVVCGFIYLRMIKREVPEPIGKLQAILPVVLGCICVPISAGSGIGLLFVLRIIGIEGTTMQALPASFFTAFFMAGGVEELFKFLAIIITLVVLKNKVSNVYEYILLGAAVGFGFTFVEDFTFGDSIIVLLIRTPLAFTHMTLNMIMGEFMGRARYNKLQDEGPTVLYWVLALIIPMALHTLYDAGTIFNFSVLKNGDFVTGGILGGVAILTNIVLLIYVLVRAKKNAEKFSALSVLIEDEQ